MGNLLSSISGSDNSTYSSERHLLTIEGSIDGYEDLGSSADLVYTMESLTDLIDSVSTLESSDEVSQLVGIRAVSLKAENLFGESFNSEEGVSEVLGRIKTKIKSATSRISDIARAAGKRVSRSMNVLRKDSRAREEKLGYIVEDMRHLKSRDKEIFKKTFPLKGVKAGLSTVDGKFSNKEILALLRRHISIVEATIKIDKEFHSTIKSVKEGMESGHGGWEEKNYVSSGQEVKKLLANLKKIGGGDLRKTAKSSSKSSREFPGGEVHTYGPFYNGKIIEVLIDTSNDAFFESKKKKERNSRLLKCRTIKASTRTRSEFGEGTVETLTLAEIAKINDLCIKLVSLISECAVTFDKGGGPH